jgi:hypothetical protein
MLKLLAPFIVLSTSVQAGVFKSPVQVNFVIEDFSKAKYYNWSETTFSWSGKPNTPTGELEPYDLGALMIRGTDDGRTFNLSIFDPKKVHMVSRRRCNPLVKSDDTFSARSGWRTTRLCWL